MTDPTDLDPTLCPPMPDSSWCLSNKPQSFKEIFEKFIDEDNKKRKAQSNAEKQTNAEKQKAP